MNYRGRVAVVASMILIGPGVTIADAWADSGAAHMVRLIGPDSYGICATGEIFGGTPGRYGFVVLHEVNGVFRAVVSLKSVTPNSQYQVRLIQSNRDCFERSGTVRTNAAGNGTVKFSEPIKGTGFYVAVDSDETGESYRSTMRYPASAKR